MKPLQLITSETPLLVPARLAKIIGLNEAIILQQLHYWLLKSKNVHKNRKWVYNSIPEWSKIFPFFSPNTIRRAFKNLKMHRIICTGCYNKKKYDRTTWYTIDYHQLADLCLPYSLGVNEIVQSEQVEMPHVGKPIPENIKENTKSTESEQDDPVEMSIAEHIYDLYSQKVRAGARNDAIRNIKKCLRTYSQEILATCIDRYISDPSTSNETKYRIQANNFFGQKARFLEFLDSPNAGGKECSQTEENYITETQKILLEQREKNSNE
jgi:hypothetical protein